MDTSVFLLAADTILFLHVLFVVFVVLGLLLIYVGKIFTWSWIRNPWFRLAHLLAIVVVVAQSWIGVICPLTSWEMSLRQLAGDTTYSGTFLSHWLSRALYYQFPAWLFVISYTGFGGLVVASWVLVRPRPFIRPTCG